VGHVRHRYSQPPVRTSVAGPTGPTPRGRGSVRAPLPCLDGDGECGYTLVEMLISIFILMIVSGLMMQGVLDMRRLNDQQSNRSDMHAGIRNATALLQQEVGQAGRMAFPGAVTLSSAVGSTGTHTVAVTSTAAPATASMFPGLRVVVDVGVDQEIVELLDVNHTTGQIQANFTSMHPAGARVIPAAGFSAGVIPTTVADGSTASLLKIVGDINDDGRLVYVEYRCDWGEGRLYRNMMPFDVATKPAVTAREVLLDNLLPNPADPDGTVPPCFNYQEHTFDGRTFVVNVAIMTTVRTHNRDPITREFQTVTKALLNVAPRNVFNVWQIASLGYSDRIQPLPPSVVDLLPVTHSVPDTDDPSILPPLIDETLDQLP
jgi:type II secretory pathway pseudopilin PulG